MLEVVVLEIVVVGFDGEGFELVLVEDEVPLEEGCPFELLEHPASAIVPKRARTTSDLFGVIVLLYE